MVERINDLGLQESGPTIKEVTIPGHVSGLRIKHFKPLCALEQISDWESPTIGERMRVNMSFTGMHEKEIRQVSVSSQNELFDRICDTICTYKRSLTGPPKEIKYEGKTYTLADAIKQPTGWFVDIESSDFKEDPGRLAAFCYIEKGMTYATVDENKNIINPLGDRQKVFEKHMPLNLYLDLVTFFLTVYVESMGPSIQIEQMRNEVKQLSEKLSLLNGRGLFTESQKSSTQIGTRSSAGISSTLTTGVSSLKTKPGRNTSRRNKKIR